MGDMQDKVLDAIKERAELQSLEFVRQPEFVNTGTVFLMKGLETKLSFCYDFQPSNATLQFYPSGEKPRRTCGFTDKSCVLHSYLRYEDLFGEMKKVFALIDANTGI